ncbi:GNAT family N-acetyltransferase [Leifsonia sp. NPDC058194]|uniref:GNAT family N-acetyltransferase n=1 Tax=Leifsonia sp. NPDC058194 TaxID=3346374 RepID=UPI0036DBF08A
MPFPRPDEAVPEVLRTDAFLLRPITADDAKADHEAVMQTRDLLRLWEQTSWPADDFTVADNREDLVELAERHSAGRAFTFTVRDPGDSRCLGCVYIFPHDAAFLARASVTARGNVDWATVDAVVYFWLRTGFADDASDASLLDALRRWFSDTWHLTRVVYVTSELVTRQTALLEQAGLPVWFELREPGKAAPYRAYGDPVPLPRASGD